MNYAGERQSRTARTDALLTRVQITRLETLIKKYAVHVGNCEGVSYLENRYRGAFGGSEDRDLFTDREWMDIRRIAGETE